MSFLARNNINSEELSHGTEEQHIGRKKTVIVDQDARHSWLHLIYPHLPLRGPQKEEWQWYTWSHCRSLIRGSIVFRKMDRSWCLTKILLVVRAVKDTSKRERERNVIPFDDVVWRCQFLVLVYLVLYRNLTFINK